MKTSQYRALNVPFNLSPSLQGRGMFEIAYEERLTFFLLPVTSLTIHRCIHLLCFFLFLLGATCAFGSPPQRLTTHPALDYQSAVSADGQTMAFVSMRSGNADIWIQPLGRASLSLPRQVTTHPASDQEPALNRDGTRLLYVSHRSDPRGDVYLLDLITGKEERLTDLSSGDAFPQWNQEEKGYFYLKRDPLLGTSAIFRKSFSNQPEELIVPQATSFSVNAQGQLVYSNGTQLSLMNLKDNNSTPLSQDGNVLDIWPVLDRHLVAPNTNQPLFFTRYEQDTNGDGRVDTDDESSIWMKYWDSQSQQFQGVYRITPAHKFHMYPAVSGDFLYYSDLKAGDIFRVDIPAFLKDYTNLDQAKTLATTYQDLGQSDLALLVLTNISHNLLAQQSSDARAE
ncbi:MAG: hypothetical protein ABIR84_10270, partial [Candidatus Nitrotoga sp.]